MSTAAILFAVVIGFGGPGRGGSAASGPGKRTSCKPLCKVELVDGCCPAELDPKAPPPPASTCANLAACAAACDRGDGASCARAGTLSQDVSAGAERDHARAFIYLDRGCRLRDARACQLGYAGFRYAYEGMRNLEAAVKSDQIACNAGDPNTCRKLATLHHNDGKYAGLEQRACDLGSAEACSTLADAYAVSAGQAFGGGNLQVGIGPPPSPTTHAKLVERACALGRVQSCLAVAGWTLRDPSRGRFPERWKRVRALLEPLCNRGEGAACRTFGELHDELAQQADKPSNFDAELGPRLFDHACALRDAEGCRLYGVAILKAQGFKGDMTHAERVLNESCTLGSGRGCVAASQVTHDKRSAQALIDRGCQLGMRGAKGAIYTNVHIPELPQPLGCGARR